MRFLTALQNRLLETGHDEDEFQIEKTEEKTSLTIELGDGISMKATEHLAEERVHAEVFDSEGNAIQSNTFHIEDLDDEDVEQVALVLSYEIDYWS